MLLRWGIDEESWTEEKLLSIVESRNLSEWEQVDLIITQNPSICEAISKSKASSPRVVNIARNSWQHDPVLSKYYVDLHLKFYGFGASSIRRLVSNSKKSTILPALIEHPEFDGKAWFWIADVLNYDKFTVEILRATSHLVTLKDCELLARDKETSVALLCSLPNTDYRVVKYFLEHSSTSLMLAAVEGERFPRELNQEFYIRICEKFMDNKPTIFSSRKRRDMVRATIVLMVSGVLSEETVRVLVIKYGMRDDLLRELKFGQLPMNKEFIYSIIPESHDLPWDWFAEVLVTHLEER